MPPLESSERARRLFMAARELDAVNLEQFLDAACDTDPSLRSHVLELLRIDSEEGGDETAPRHSAHWSHSVGEEAPARLSRVLGNYLLEKRLGRGAMGVVYLAKDLRLDRPVAIKLLPPQLARDPIWIDRLTQEAKTVAKLNHPHIAQIYELAAVGEDTFLVLEYVPGSTLRRWIESSSTPSQITYRLASQMAGGLAAAHNRGVVHRDLKPANVQITPEANVKILDFGLAIRRPAGSFGPSQIETMTHEQPFLDRPALPVEALGRWLVGTPGYASPEQIRGEPVDNRTDIFSFGCVLYECLTGKMAFHGRTVRESLEAALLGEPDWDSLPRDTPAPVRSLLTHCLEKRTRQRLRNIQDARDTLDTVLSERTRAAEPAAPTPVAPNNLPAPLTRFVGRYQQVARLVRLLEAESRLLTLTGLGGCGKTRLSLEIGRRLLRRFQDGVWLAELGPLHRGSDVIRAVAIAIGVPANSSAMTEESIAQFVASKDILLILDNCEHLLEHVAPLCNYLLRSCPRMVILATTQQDLGLPGEMVYRVNSLTIPGAADAITVKELLQSESAQLFYDRARLARPEFDITPGNARAVAEICNHLDGIPLAIELAASRVGSLDVEQIAIRLHQRFRLLRSTSAVGLARHHTLLAAVTWSYGLLPEAEQDALRRLSLLAGTWSVDAGIAALRDVADEIEAIELLSSLVRKSLLVPSDTEETDRSRSGYRLPESIREFALDALTSHGDGAAAREAALCWLLECLHRGGLKELDRYFLESTDLNLMAALTWCEEGTARHSALRAALSECVDNAGATRMRGDNRGSTP